MKYCSECLMPDTRPGIKFIDGVCVACIHYKKQKETNWDNRKQELEILCDKYRTSNRNEYDCAIAVSGGKDSHFQVYIMKEIMKMNPVLLTVENIHPTETGKKNLQNLSDAFDCDIIKYELNDVKKELFRKVGRYTFEEYGFPTWYIDSLVYAFPVRKTMDLGLKLLVYGEDVNYTYGGKYDEETPSAMMQSKNDVVRPIHTEMIEKGIVSEKEIADNITPEYEKFSAYGLEPIYLSYFVPWNSHHNFEVAKRWGFRHLGHEYKREGAIEDYNSIDSITYLISEFLKYTKYGHSSTTQMASRWIRYGMKTREAMIPIVKKYDKNLDQGIVEGFCEIIGMEIKEFYDVLDKWYNKDLFVQDQDKIWHEKFEVGKGF